MMRIVQDTGRQILDALRGKNRAVVTLNEQAALVPMRHREKEEVLEIEMMAVRKRYPVIPVGAVDAESGRREESGVALPPQRGSQY